MKPATALVFTISILSLGAAPVGARVYQSSFESLNDFSGFYIVPPGDYDSDHALSPENVHSGTLSHKAWILRPRDTDNDGPVYLPHRAYPTIQLQKTPGGVFQTPCLITLWVNLDVALQDRGPGMIDDWFSFMTFTTDPTDAWKPVVVVNYGLNGYVYLGHVPREQEQIHTYQAGPGNDPGGALRFPQRQWTRLDVYLDMDPVNGQAKVWQNGALVSSALIEGGNGTLAQAHFGLYSSAATFPGVVYNDDLRIQEVADEAEADLLMSSLPGRPRRLQPHP
jgi:hypothetical protein